MQVRGCHLIVALLALWLSLPAGTASPKHAPPRASFEVPARLAPLTPQEAGTKAGAKRKRGAANREPRNTVIIRPASHAAQEGLPDVTVTVNRKRVPLGEEVTFTLQPESVVLSPLFVITLYFGDGTHQEVHQTRIVHLYGSAGLYKYSISIKPSGQVPHVSLTATPRSVAVGNEVVFTAHTSSAYPNLRYRFVFGDNFQSDWQVRPETTHKYVTRGTYLAYVDIAVTNNGLIMRMGGSVRSRIDVSPPPLVVVDLTASPTPVEVGRPVTFSARVYPTYPTTEYRFVFGDGSSSGGWQLSPQTTHVYLAPGRYSAFVQIGQSVVGRIDMMAASQLKRITVARPSPPGPGPSPAPYPPSVSPRPTPRISPTPVSPTPTPSPVPSVPPIGPVSPTPASPTPASPTPTPSPESSVPPIGPISPHPSVSPTPSPTPFQRPRWGWGICLFPALLLLLLLIGYWIWPSLLGGGRTLESHFDPGVSTVKDGPLISPLVPPRPVPRLPVPFPVRPPLGPIGPFPDAPLLCGLERRWLHYAFLSRDNKLGLVANLATLGPPPGSPGLGTFSTFILLIHREGQGWCASQFNANTLGPFWSAFRQPHLFGVPSPFKMAATSEQVEVDLELQRTSRPCNGQCSPFATNMHLRWQSETGVKAHGDWYYKGQVFRDVDAVGYHERVRGCWGWPELGGWVFGFANDPARDPGGTAPPIAVVFTLIQLLRPADASRASVMLWKRGRLLRHFPRRCVSVAARGELDKDYIQQVPVLSNHLGVPPMATIPRRLVISAAMGKDWVVLDFLCEQAARVVIPSETSIGPFSVHEVIGPVKVEGEASGHRFSFQTRGIVEFAGGAGGD